MKKLLLTILAVTMLVGSINATVVFADIPPVTVFEPNICINNSTSSYASQNSAASNTTLQNQILSNTSVTNNTNVCLFSYIPTSAFSTFFYNTKEYGKKAFDFIANKYDYVNNLFYGQVLNAFESTKSTVSNLAEFIKIHGWIFI